MITARCSSSIGAAPAAGLLVLIFAPPAAAHSGGTDAAGCHTNRKTGEYHCHGGRAAPPPPRTPSRPVEPPTSLVAPPPGEPPPIQVIEREPTATRDLILTTQLLLTALGYEPGPPAGFITAETAAAIRAFQTAASLDADGRATSGLLVRLARQVLDQAPAPARPPPEAPPPRTASPPRPAASLLETRYTSVRGEIAVTGLAVNNTGGELRGAAVVQVVVGSEVVREGSQELTLEAQARRPFQVTLKPPPGEAWKVRAFWRAQAPTK